MPIEMLGSEYCSGYYDLRQGHAHSHSGGGGRWVEGFYCPQPESKSANFCCGSSATYKYCCNHEMLLLDPYAIGSADGDGTSMDAFGSSIFEPTEIPVIVGLVLCGLTLITIAACYYCTCCVHFFKKRLDELEEAASMTHFLWHGVYDVQQAQAARDSVAAAAASAAAVPYDWQTPAAAAAATPARTAPLPTNHCNGAAGAGVRSLAPPAKPPPLQLPDIDAKLLIITDELNQLSRAVDAVAVDNDARVRVRLRTREPGAEQEGVTSFGSTGSHSHTSGDTEDETDACSCLIPEPVEELNCVNEMIQYQKQIEDMFPLPLPRYEHYHAEEPAPIQKSVTDSEKGDDKKRIDVTASNLAASPPPPPPPPVPIRTRISANLQSQAHPHHVRFSPSPNPSTFTSSINNNSNRNGKTNRNGVTPLPYLIPDSARPPIHPSTRRRPTTVHYGQTNGSNGSFAGAGRIDLSPRVSPYSTLPLPQSPKFMHKNYANTVKRNGNGNPS